MIGKREQDSVSIHTEKLSSMITYNVIEMFSGPSSAFLDWQVQKKFLGATTNIKSYVLSKS